MSNLGFAKLVSGFDVSEIALQVMHTFLLSFKDQYVKCVYFKYVHQIGKLAYDKSLFAVDIS